MSTAVIPAPKKFVEKTDIVNNLTSGGTTVPLSAEMGKVLNANLGSKYGTQGDVSVASEVYTDICSMDLSAGVYIVLRGCDFNANNAGIRRVGKGSGAGREECVTANACQTGDTFLQYLELLVIQSTTTIKTVAYQTSGSAVMVWGYMYAMKLK